jgi:hypothetical protein
METSGKEEGEGHHKKHGKEESEKGHGKGKEESEKGHGKEKKPDKMIHAGDHGANEDMRALFEYVLCCFWKCLCLF